MKLKIPFASFNDEKNSDYIPLRFQREVLTHIFKNYYADKNPDFSTPLILAISGAPGMGKSYQVEKTLELTKDKIMMKKMSGADFENEHAGVPEKNLRKLYMDVSDSILFKEIYYGVIMIDDIDSALGKWDDLVQYTMNRQLMIKTLIDLADNPYKVDYVEDNKLESKPTRRVPFIVTLNDEQKMYKPLMRNGRTRNFPWIPDREDIEMILSSIFRDIDYDFDIMMMYDKLSKITQNTLPLSLFADLKSSLNNDVIWEIIKKEGINSSACDTFNQHLKNPKIYCIDDFIEVGLSLITENKNYLVEGGN